MHVDKDKVISLLGSGATVSQVAGAVGCDISYISQLLADENIAKQVAEKRTEEVLKYKTMDDKYDELENKLLKKLEDILPFIVKPDQIVRSLQFINGAKRKATGSLGMGIEAGEIVRLQLPKVVINQYTINMSGGMVKVGDRSLAPMPSDKLLKTLELQNGVPNGKEKIPELVGEGDAPRLPKEHVINEKSV